MSACFNPALTVDVLLRLGSFAPHVSSEFAVQRGSEWLTVTLAEATAASGHRPEIGEKFSLIFTGGLEKPLQQGIHDFEHQALGAFELFITPVRSSHTDQRWYEAVINRETGR